MASAGSWQIDESGSGIFLLFSVLSSAGLPVLQIQIGLEFSLFWKEILEHVLSILRILIAKILVFED